MVLGDSGVGKTWFCLNAIFQLLEHTPETQVLYSNFHGNFRITNLKRLLSSSRELDQISIFQPNNLLEQIVFFRNLHEISRDSYDLIILDSVFGSPLTSFEYFRKKAKFWEKRIFSHLLDLHNIAREFKIPLLLTNHLVPTRENFETKSSLNQYGGYLAEQFVPIEFLIQKIEQKQLLEVRIFQKIVGSSDFTIVLPRSDND